MKLPIPFGKYFLLEPIATGSIAEVFRAKSAGAHGFERIIAIKRIVAGLSQNADFIERFVAESKIAMQLSHANIAQVFDFGKVGGRYYLALEHIHGRSMRSVLEACRKKTTSLSIAQACFVSMKICEGLDYAHNKRDNTGRALSLVHRDISPQNILLSFDGEVKMIDFGIARATRVVPRAENSFSRDKAGYRSPEQVSGVTVGRRTDVFSTGVCLYEMLTGQRLFAGQSEMSILESIRQTEIPLPSLYNPSIPRELEKIVLRALDSRVDRRYQNAIDLHDELQAFAYTTGDFYSRKDLSQWMRSMFPSFGQEAQHIAKIRKADVLLDGGSRPPPIPPAVPSKVTARGSARTSGIPFVPSTSPVPPRRVAAMARTAPPIPISKSSVPSVSNKHEEQLAETGIYGASEMPTALGTSGIPDLLGVTPQEPDLSSFLPQTKWEGDTPKASPLPELRAMPVVFPTAQTPVTAGVENHLVERTVADYLPSAFVSFLSSPRLWYWTAAAAALLVGGLLIGIVVQRGDGGSNSVVATSGRDKDVRGQGAGSLMAAKAVTGNGSVRATGETMPNTMDAGNNNPDVVATDIAKIDATGFELYIRPAPKQIQWDGVVQTWPVPGLVRRLKPGNHSLSIVAPDGYDNYEETIAIRSGEIQKVSIDLERTKIRGAATSVPSGAHATLLYNGERTLLGQTPTSLFVDPQVSYQILFEKAGYAASTRQVQIVGDVAIAHADLSVLSKEQSLGISRPATVSKSKVSAKRSTVSARSKMNKQRTQSTNRTAAAKTSADNVLRPKKSDRMGLVTINSKPSCKLFIDGDYLGRTPKAKIKLVVGRHIVTLVNEEFGIRRKFSMTVRPGANRFIKDLTTK